MINTQTYSLPIITVAALKDELAKIAAETPKKPSKLKRFLKNTALYAGGYGVGHGAGMLIERAIKKHLGNRWPSLSNAAKKKILGPAIGLTTGASLLAASRLKRRLEESYE